MRVDGATYILYVPRVDFISYENVDVLATIHYEHVIGCYFFEEGRNYFWFDEGLLGVVGEEAPTGIAPTVAAIALLKPYDPVHVGDWVDSRVPVVQ